MFLSPNIRSGLQIIFDLILLQKQQFFIKIGIHRSPWDSLHNARDAPLCCFLWAAPEQTVEQTIETPMIWDAIVLIMMSQ